MSVVTTRPACLDRSGAARYLSLSESTLEKLTREQADFPKPRVLSGRRTGWLVRELDAWLESRPVSSFLPPPNTGAAKPRPRCAALNESAGKTINE